jgi:hypothetical protein
LNQQGQLFEEEAEEDYEDTRQVSSFFPPYLYSSLKRKYDKKKKLKKKIVLKIC